MTTITMTELYTSALHEIMSKYELEEKINDNTIVELGRENRIAKAHMDKYDAQMDELTNLIIEAEKSA